MRVTIEIDDYSDPAKQNIRVHNAWHSTKDVVLEVAGEKYTVDGKELISAVQRCMLDSFGR